MKRIPIIVLSFVVILGLLVVGCAPPETPEATVEHPTEVVAPPTVEVEVVENTTIEPEIAATDSSAQLVALQTAPEVELDTACIDCHSNAELLQEVATVAEAKESLNEGTG